MKKTNRFISRLLTAVLSGTIAASGIPSHAVSVPLSSQQQETTAPEPMMISVVEGETSEYGFTPTTYVDEYGNETEADLIPDKEPRAAALPSQFDLRDYGYITPVKNQGDTGTCWAHASLAAAESNMVMKGIADNTIDLSESHLTWFTQGAASRNINDPLYGDGESLGNTDLNNGAYDRGGNHLRARASLGRWSGVQLEENAPPISERPAVDESLRYTSYGYLVNSDDIDKDDRESIKQHLMNTGALICSYYTDSEKYISGQYYPYASYYCPDFDSSTQATNHEVTIVGWDDNYSKDNFMFDVPPDDGAWIVKNSWGEDSHIDGYFYLSYYDSSLSGIASFEIADKSTYNNIYQYDGASPDSYLYYLSSAFTAANIFTAESNETISAAAFYTYEASVPYTVSVYADVQDGKPTSGRLLATTSGTIPYKGYHVVNLNEPVAVSKGTKFSVVVTLDKAGTRMAVQKCSSLNDCSYYTSGTPKSSSQWTDTISKYSATACIKALTKSDVLINASNFPDEAFRTYVSDFDLDSDGALSSEEIYQVSEMNLSKLGISDFTGIEFFTELAKLNCSYNPITKLDISHNNILNDFICIGCSIGIDKIACNGFTIDGLDMSKVSNIKGMTAKDSMFIPDGGTMSYTYYCGRNYTAEIVINVGEVLHGYGSWSAKGDSHVKTCFYCGSEASENHQFDEWNGDSNGHLRICLVCGGTEFEKHSFGDWKTDEVSHTHSCEICGFNESSEHTSDRFESQDDKEHNAICESCGYTELRPHNFGAFTESDEKTHAKVCTDCGYSESFEHSLGVCITNGEESHSRTCPDCGYSENSVHSFGEWISYGESLHKRSCTDCGQVVSGSHNFGEFSSIGTEKHSKVCKDCGYIVGLAHNFGDWISVDASTHSRTCPDCGLVNSVPHNFGNWTISEDGSHSRECSDCGYTESSLHTFGEAKSINGDTHYISCEICGHTELSTHSFGEIAHTDDENHSCTCEECGYVYIFKHNFSEWEYSGESSHSKICLECKQIITMPHSFGKCESTDESEHSISCEMCGYTISSPHSLTEWQDNGNAERIRKCIDCDYSEIEKVHYISGDINGDNVIDSFDLVIAKQRLNKDFLNSAEFASADINQDGKFDINDVILLQDFILGKIKVF